MQTTELECRAGIQCFLTARVDTGPLELDGLSIGNLKLSASMAIANDETLRVDVSPNATVTLTGVESESFSVASITTTQFSGAQLVVDDQGWRSHSDQVEVMIDTWTDRESLIASLPMTLNALRLGGNGVESRISVEPYAATVSWNGTGIFTPGVEGKLSLQDQKAAASLVLADGAGALYADIEALQDLASGQGTISASNVLMDFNQTNLSGHLLEWSYPWDVVAGTWSTALTINLKSGDTQTEYEGTMSHHADALAGNYNDIVFAGLNTDLSGNLHSVTGLTLSPATIELALLDVGLPVENISADVALEVSELAARVENLSMSLLGGQVVADPFRYAMRQERDDITLRPKSVQLQFMVDLAEFDDIKLSGSISGVLPVTISDSTTTITDGRLDSDAPGGVIRYLPGNDTGDEESSDFGLGLVTRALANFHFDSLSSDVDYVENGDLKLQMKVTGVNPEMDATQPVILNLGVENNVPQLLRSLQATRTIEELLEKRSAN